MSDPDLVQMFSTFKLVCAVQEAVESGEGGASITEKAMSRVQVRLNYRIFGELSL